MEKFERKHMYSLKNWTSWFLISNLKSWEKFQDTQLADFQTREQKLQRCV